MEVLSKLFGSAARVKLLRLFLFNEGENFETGEIARRAHVTPAVMRSETAMMEKVGLVRRKSFFVEAVTGSGKRKKTVKKKVRGWTLDQKFKYLSALRNFLLTAAPVQQNDIVKKLGGVGKCKLIILAGAFIQDWNSRLDLLIVGDGIDRGRLETAVKHIEAELGKELRYAVFDTRDFAYRLNIYDKLIRDVFDYPHQTVLNRLGEWYDSSSHTLVGKRL
ncbi:hypothetical protein A3D62_01370 [Candidatus Kaiserbacteria bacterium RIFCSPHIGHO2_02_FULL_49_11]|uniref:HTH arsR-type domain-containing protein n=1 Tax=Candidatus Kaiserbacteria bacterium RIFCSPHIGHO2_02_FULL_49_11 TaxID=1798489 RepID=A0A1F6D177_9BACT|nr:MAG: hypothetical protein A3D62_01370 [Candidatus Kaiserbacteria bacterium RIFCSPHIGHO2_02_FULL_49_11]